MNEVGTINAAVKRLCAAPAGVLLVILPISPAARIAWAAACPGPLTQPLRQHPFAVVLPRFARKGSLHGQECAAYGARRRGFAGNRCGSRDVGSGVRYGTCGRGSLRRLLGAGRHLSMCAW